MRTVHRKIVGAFIFSADGKVLLGHNIKGGTYQGMLVIPGGGIEAGETELEAVKREILEETGIDISHGSIKQLEAATAGESQKTLRDTGETVLMKMEFYDFIVELADKAAAISLAFEDDFGEASWYTAAELQDAVIGPNTKITLQKLGFL